MSLIVRATPLPGLTVLERPVYEDSRGSFSETYNERAFEAAVGVRAKFVQDNESLSVRHVLRGMHFQLRRPQGKLVRVISGMIFDATIDMRRSSPTFGQWFGMRLDADSRLQLWIPPGFAHGFLVLSETARVAYKTTDYWDPTSEQAVRWNDPQVCIEWPLSGQPILSLRDSTAPYFAEVECYA